MQEGKTIGQLMEEMRQKAGAQNYHGHDYMDLQRFAENTRHMIIFDVLTNDSPVGWKGERTRLFLSDIGYEKALDSQAKGQIKILSHAKVRNGDLFYDHKEQIGEEESDMNEEKKVPFKWEYGEETISLQLGMYANNQRLYIGMITHTEDGAEPFADMTVNLPGYSLDPGEAFISGDISKDLLRFIKENKLGKVLPYQVQSGYGKYSAVAFDLEKLKAFDPKGVAEFRKEWNLPDKKPVKKKSRGMER